VNAIKTLAARKAWALYLEEVQKHLAEEQIALVEALAETTHVATALVWEDKDAYLAAIITWEFSAQEAVIARLLERAKKEGQA